MRHVGLFLLILSALWGGRKVTSSHVQSGVSNDVHTMDWVPIPPKP